MSQPRPSPESPRWALSETIDEEALALVCPEVASGRATVVRPPGSPGERLEAWGRLLREGNLDAAVLPLSVLPAAPPEGLTLERVWVEREPPPGAATLSGEATRGGGAPAREALDRPGDLHPAYRLQLLAARPEPDGTPPLLPRLTGKGWGVLARERRPPREAPVLGTGEEPGEWALHRALEGFLRAVASSGGELPCADAYRRGHDVRLEAFAYFPERRRAVRHRMYGPDAFAREIGRRAARLMRRAPGGEVPEGFPEPSR
jgi:hypothetical protein